jgi:predicted PurR-regulated permease PerM
MESQAPAGMLTRQAIEISIKIAALFFVLAWCYKILHPFIMPVVWAAIIAVAIGPVCGWVQSRIGGNRKLAAIIVTASLLALLITPAVILSEKLYDNVRYIAVELDNNKLRVPPPNERVKSWPLVGEKVYDGWSEAANNLDDTLRKYEPQLKAAARTGLNKAAGMGVGLLVFIFSIVISGFLLASGNPGKEALIKFSRRLAGESGERFVNIAGITVRNVTRGILGVAVIQTLLAALGLFVMDIPAAALLAVAVLVLAVVQLGAGLVLIPVSIYAYSVADPVLASLFLLWNIFVSLIDNILKPLLMGQGASVPTLVIFLGAIGGFIAEGLVGLFVGAVVVVMGYELFMNWLDADLPGEDVQAAP